MADRSSRNALRNIAAILVLIPIAIVFVAFALANRASVTVSLDPFASTPPAAAVTLPLFALVIVLLIAGVVIGGAATWLGQRKWRRAARRRQRELTALRGEVAALNPAASTDAMRATEPPRRLKLKPPVQ